MKRNIESVHHPLTGIHAFDPATASVQHPRRKEAYSVDKGNLLQGPLQSNLKRDL